MVRWLESTGGRKAPYPAYIRTAESLIVGKVANLIAKREASRQLDSRESVKKVRIKKHYRCCRETSYNAYTYTVKILDTSNSNKSK